MECNKNVPNINLRSRNITFALNLWLFLHFVCLSINYSYYDAVALFYRFWCTIWMFLYCYPFLTYNTYHWFKQQLPNRTRPFLRVIRDRLVPKIWRNLRTVIERRRREEEVIIDDERSHWNISNNLQMIPYERKTFLLFYVIVCVPVSCLLTYYTGWDLALLVPTMILILTHSICVSHIGIMLCHYLYPEPVDNIDKSSCFISISDSSSTHGAVEKFELNHPIRCTELD